MQWDTHRTPYGPPVKSRAFQRAFPIDSTPGSSTGAPRWIPQSELGVLPELTPPSVMPQGNVGTPLSAFMELIRQCKLPSRVIKKLRIEFPMSRTQRRYGAVQMDYGTTSVGTTHSEMEGCTTNTTHEEGATTVRLAWLWDRERKEGEGGSEEGG